MERLTDIEVIAGQVHPIPNRNKKPRSQRRPIMRERKLLTLEELREVPQ